MNAISNYWLFLLSGIILNITPGSDTIYILSRSIAQGKKAGVLSVLGISTGSLVHTVLVTTGISLILSKSLLAFSIIKYCGAAYLLYIGIRTILKKESIIEIDKKTKASTTNRKIYVQGILTNILNPKVILFFLTFLPQFIIPEKGNAQIGLLLLGITFICTGTLWCLLLVYFSSFFTEKARKNLKISQILNKASGVVFIGLGLKVGLGE